MHCPINLNEKNNTIFISTQKLKIIYYLHEGVFDVIHSEILKLKGIYSGIEVTPNNLILTKDYRERAWTTTLITQNAKCKTQNAGSVISGQWSVVSGQFSHHSSLSQQLAVGSQQLSNHQITKSPNFHPGLILKITNSADNFPTIIQELFIPENGCFFTIKILCIPTQSFPLKILNFKPLIIINEVENQGNNIELGSTDVSKWSIFNLGYQSWSPAYAENIFAAKQIPRLKLVTVGALNPNMNYPTKRGKFICDWLCAIKDINTNNSLTLGFITMADQLSQICLSANPETKKVSTLYAQSNFEGIAIENSQTYSSEELYCSLTTDNAVESLEEYANLVQHKMNVKIFNKTLSGWCSWYYYFTKIKGKDILANLKKIKKLKNLIPIKLIQIDDGYQQSIGDWTNWKIKKFPNGIKQIASEIEEDGFIAGLWLAPFFARPDSKIFKKHPDWFLKDAKGTMVLAGFNPLWGGKVYALDLTHPEVKNWLADIFRKIVFEWGFKFLKLDFLYSGTIVGKKYNPALTSAQSYRQALQLIRKTVGEDIFILGCGAPLGPSIGIVDGMRISTDVAPKWDEPVLTYLTNSKSIPCAKHSIMNCLTRSFLNKKFWLNDPDCVIVRDKNSKLTKTEVVTLATVVSLTGSMVLISDDFAKISSNRLNILNKILPPLEEFTASLPIDLFESAIPRILSVKVSSTTRIIAIFNWKNYHSSFILNFKDIKLDPLSNYFLFDFWEEIFLGVFCKNIKFTNLSPHSCKLLKIVSTAGTHSPTVLFSSAHISQGEFQTIIQKWDEDSKKLNIKINIKGKRRGILYILFPKLQNARETNSKLPFLCHHNRNVDTSWCRNNQIKENSSAVKIMQIESISVGKLVKLEIKFTDSLHFSLRNNSVYPLVRVS